MEVLSLFDGISCGRVALKRVYMTVDKYYAYEIEPNAIKISKKNYPDIIHCGDVITADFTKYKGIDLLIGGSPCQSLSIVQSKTRQNLDGKSKLFFEFVRALEETQPKYFLFENVASMNEESKRVISELLGCDPIYIDSNCCSAQDRPRLYWTNIPVKTDGLKECNLCLNDILESNVDEKYYLPDDRIEKILNSTFMQEKKRIQMTDICDTLLARDYKDPKCVPVEEEPEVKQLMNIMPTKTRDNPNQGRVYDVNGIAPTLTKMDGGNREPMVIDEIKVVGNYMPSNHDASRVVDVDGIAPTVKENHGTVTAIAEPFIVASRGRNPENPSDRTVGMPTGNSVRVLKTTPVSNGFNIGSCLP